MAVTPRFGPPLARATRRRFSELGVRHVRLRSHPRYAWYHYLNTPIALAAAEELTDARPDLLGGLGPAVPGRAARACCSSRHRLRRRHDRQRRHRHARARARRTRPTGAACCDAASARPRRAAVGRRRSSSTSASASTSRPASSPTGAASASRSFYLDMCTDGSRPAASASRTTPRTTLDQVCLGLAVHKRACAGASSTSRTTSRWRASCRTLDLPEQLAQARILHYHDAMEPHFCATCLRAARRRPPRGARVAERRAAADRSRRRGLAAGPAGAARSPAACRGAATALASAPEGDQVGSASASTSRRPTRRPAASGERRSRRSTARSRALEEDPSTSSPQLDRRAEHRCRTRLPRRRS